MDEADDYAAALEARGVRFGWMMIVLGGMGVAGGILLPVVLRPANSFGGFIVVGGVLALVVGAQQLGKSKTTKR